MKEPTRNERIVGLYKAGDSAYEIAGQFNITSRQVQRIVNKAGAARTQAESFRLAIERGRMVYHHKPAHLKAQRKSLPLAMRYAALERDHYTCKLCGNRPEDGHRIEVDHIDNDATHNELSNLQVLCDDCNKGKAWFARTPHAA